MATTDINVFAQPDFNIKAWVNNICKTKPEEEAIDRYLAEMEMRLQLSAEEIEAGLQETSSQAMRRIPFAIQEIYRLQGDVQGMQDQVRVLAGRVAGEASEASSAVSHLQQLDGVKRNMEAAFSTLKEATELSGMFIKVEDVFASGDLPQVASLLRSMRASLALVGDVPEFKEGRGKLRQLEDRLQAQVEGALAAALSSSSPADAAVDQDQEAHTRSLCELLLAVDRYSTIESLYVRSRMTKVTALLEEVATPQGPGSASVGQWLPVLYSRLLPLLRSEVSWGSRVLPAGDAAALAQSLATAAFDKVSKAASSRLMDKVSPATLVPMAVDMANVANSVAGLLPAGLPAAARADLVIKVLAPLEDAVSRYVSLEASSLESELVSLLPKDLAATEGDVLVRQLWESTRRAADCCCAAIDRCVSLTGGTELHGLAASLDKLLTSFIVKVSNASKDAVSRARQQAAARQGQAGMDEASEEVSTALRLVVLSGELSGPALLRRVDAAIRTAVDTTLHKMEASVTAYHSSTSNPSATNAASNTTAGGSKEEGSLRHAHSGIPAPSTAASSSSTAGVDPVGIRLGGNASRYKKVQTFAKALSDPRSTPLPKATNESDVLMRTIQSVALDALLARVKTLLQPFTGLQQWKQRLASGSGSQMPSFLSVEPLQYIVQLGDYLMCLPQQLELLFSDPLMASNMTQDEQDELAASWLDKVVAGAAQAVSDTISKLTEISPQGGIQLAADVEYLCNVMSALHVNPPPSLLTIQLFAGMPDSEFPAATKAALVDGGADSTTLRMLANQRQLSIQT